MDLQNIILIAAETAEHAPEMADAAAHAAAESDVLGTLGINGKLFLAQLVNFAIVLFVLWRWVFGPVAGALEKRRERIETSLKDAKEIEERVSAFEQEHEERVQKSRAEAESIIQKAVVAANQTKTEIQESAKSEAERILLNARETIEAEKESAIKAVRQEVADLTIACTEKLIQTKLTDVKDKELVAGILEDIR